jgi:D-alanyl-lipoteichoic acid acyltransferase DltB (MBOAT superfamily)
MFDTASVQFVVFGLAVALISNFHRSAIWRSVVLLSASLGLLGLLDHKPMAFIPLGGFLALGYGGLFLRRRARPTALIGILIAVIGTYAWLKKYTLLPAGSYIKFPYFTLGLSYIFFRVIHLLVETVDSEDIKNVGPLAYLLYTLNFTTLISGPIQRYEEFAGDQFAREPIALEPHVVGLQLERIVLGFFKVNVLSALFIIVHEEALSQLYQSPLILGKCVAAFLLVVAYPFFLYTNFSGYIDIVIALARLMRIRLPENFNRPFSACSFVDFWSRWHITLSAWLKTYVFNPLLLTLMRRTSSTSLEPAFVVFSFFITFFLVGIWHGRTFEFVVFGILQGGGVAVNKLWQLSVTGSIGGNAYRSLAKNPIYQSLARGMTFSWFAFTLFWFWADWTQIGKVYAAMGFLPWLGLWLAAWLFATITLAVWESVRTALLSLESSEGPWLYSRYARVVYATAFGLVSLVITILLSHPAQVIVYKAF